MASCESRGFHRFCSRHLPFLLTTCPMMGNRHFLWRPLCVCGVGEYTDDHHSDTYRWSPISGWKKVPK